jgi:site-specific recombinase XerD
MLYPHLIDRKMAYTISLKIRSNKISKKTGVGPVYLKITKDRNTCYVSTGYRLHENEWDDHTQKVNQKHPNSVRMNKLLSTKVVELQAIALRFEDNKQPFTAKDLKESFSGGSKENFVTYAIVALERRVESDDDDRIKYSTYRRYQTAINKLSQYLGSKQLRLLDVTSDFLNDYKGHLKNKLKNRPNTINSNLRCIRCIVNLAKKDGLLSSDANPFANVSMPSEESSRGFLLEEELEAIERVGLADGSKMELHRDMFLFACNAAGIRIADLLLLKVENYDGEYLRYTMRKNGKSQKILLPEKAKDILDRYVKRENVEVDDYVFPAIKLDRSTTDERVVLKAISAATAYTNKDLKLIAEKSGVDKKVCFHMSRHSFGTSAITRGIHLDTVAKLMAHSDSSTTRIYAQWIDPVLDEAMKKFND